MGAHASASRTLFAVERGSIVFEEQVVQDEELWHDDDSVERDGWFCVRTDPFPCPAAGCTYVATFMTAAHLILCWQENDDPNLLATRPAPATSAATRASSATSPTTGRAPRTTPGSPPAGPCTASGPLA